MDTRDIHHDLSATGHGSDRSKVLAGVVGGVKNKRFQPARRLAADSWLAMQSLMVEVAATESESGDSAGISPLTCDCDRQPAPTKAASSGAFE